MTHPDLIEIAPIPSQRWIELKYATSDNFTGQPAYHASARCYLHKDAAEKLEKATNLAHAMGYGLRIYDAFRPTEVQERLWAHTPDPEFLAPPERGSPHSRGVAVDLTLTTPDGTPLDMGTAFDAFTALSHHAVTEIPVEAQKNRALLMGIMTAAGWDFYRNEWWHYQLFNSRQYSLFSDAEAGTHILP